MAAVFEDVDGAPVEEPLRAMLRFIRTMTLSPTELSGDDGAALQAAGVSRAAAEEAIAVACVFNLIDRLADSFQFSVPEDAAFGKMAKLLLKRGYA